MQPMPPLVVQYIVLIFRSLVTGYRLIHCCCWCSIQWPEGAVVGSVPICAVAAVCPAVPPVVACGGGTCTDGAYGAGLTVLAAVLAAGAAFPCSAAAVTCTMYASRYAFGSTGPRRITGIFELFAFAFALACA